MERHVIMRRKAKLDAEVLIVVQFNSRVFCLHLQPSYYPANA